jgi:hypothetical protein
MVGGRGKICVLLVFTYCPPSPSKRAKREPGEPGQTSTAFCRNVYPQKQGLPGRKNEENKLCTFDTLTVVTDTIYGDFFNT